MNGYELIALDMDGTLLTSDKRLPDETVRDINEAVARGKHVALCTGRCVPELKEYREKLASVRYAVAVSGAVLYDLWEDRTLYAVGVERELAVKIAAVGEAHGAMVHLLCEDASIVRADQARHTADFGMGPYQDLFWNISTHVDDILQAAAARPFLPKVNLYCRSKEDQASAYEILKKMPVSIALAENAGLEMSPPGVDKGSGLRRLAALLGVAMEKVIAVGDGDNDRAMLAAAGLAVAMGNAVPEAAAVADAVVADNDHNGAGEAIRRYLLR